MPLRAHMECDAYMAFLFLLNSVIAVLLFLFI